MTYLICEIWLFDLFFLQFYNSDNVKVRISRSILESPFDIEITRVDCTSGDTEV